MSTHDEVWNTRGAGSADSMPLGNGDIALNAWTEENGDIVFYIAKADAWSENMCLLKLGRVRLSFPGRTTNGGRFEQRLSLLRGELVITEIAPEGKLSVRIWADACHPVVRVAVAGDYPVEVRAVSEIWRTADRELIGRETVNAYGLHEAPRPVIELKDVVVPEYAEGVLWAHRNTTSLYAENLTLQGLGERLAEFPDPILNRTFGVLMSGRRFRKQDALTLMSERPACAHELALYAVTAQTKTLEEWAERIGQAAQAVRAVSAEDAQAAHLAWWQAFWERSRIVVSGSEEAETVSRGYTLQRYLSACAGRGDYPIKFNGSLFTFDAAHPKYPYNADFRMWGGAYWFQNTRLIYWPMLAAGDADMMEPFFRMYMRALPLAEARTRLFFNHAGAYFPETMYPWGAYVNTNYGWNREGKSIAEVDNRYIRYYFQGNLELSLMMMAYVRHTGDTALFDEMLPVIEAAIDFYRHHYPRGADGKLRMEPASSLEMWHDAVNPLPDVAGLRAVLEGMLQLADAGVAKATGDHRHSWTALLNELPPIPMDDEAGRLLPAGDWEKTVKNSESPELYAIFPYRLYGVGKPDLEIARRTFLERPVRVVGGWSQDAIQAAHLGLTEEAKRGVVLHFRSRYEKARFPAFWGPNTQWIPNLDFDWTPDQDNGCAAMIALQAMLLQADGDRLHVLPAWPEQWDVDFKLHAPLQTVVSGSVRGGRLTALEVEPASRRKDIVIGYAPTEADGAGAQSVSHAEGSRGRRPMKRSAEEEEKGR